MDKLLIKQFFFTIAVGLMYSSFAFAHHTVSSDAASVPHLTISFAEGSSQLSQADKMSLDRLIDRAESGGEEISYVAVAAWADKNLPGSGQKLTAEDRELASRRANVITAYLKEELDSADMETFNMAEGSNWLARMFNTRESDSKTVFSKKSYENPLSAQEFELIKNESSPSEAIVVVNTD